MVFEDHFSELAEKYAKFRPNYPPEMFSYLASLVHERDLAWDCGTGSGQAAIGLSAHFRRVIATDASHQQITNAFPKEGVFYFAAPAERAPLADRSANLITAAQAVHWFDFNAYYNEVRRVLKPNGVLAVWTYHLFECEPEVDRIVERLYREILDGYWPERIRYIEDRYRSLPFPLEEITAPTFTMQVEWSLDDVIGFLASWSGVKRYFNQQAVHPLNLVYRDLSRAWGKADEKRAVRWTLHFRIGVNHP